MNNDDTMPFELSEQLEDDISGQRIYKPLDDIIVTAEYRRAFQLLEEAWPAVFVTGGAGTGKSTFVDYIRSTISRELAVVAPTGVAALNVRGETIHSFFRLPPRIHQHEDIKQASNSELYRRLELLIVDEASMVRADLMDSIDRFLRKNRGNDRPFGGVQLLLVGDLYQLPPVVAPEEWNVLRARGYANPYFFSCFALQKTSLDIVELTHIFRQQDQVFVDLLNRVRFGDDGDSAIAEINRRCACHTKFCSDITLTCTNGHADRINQDEMARLPFSEHSFPGRLEGGFSLKGDRLPSPLDLRLKEGSRVMFTKNDMNGRWVNGSVGEVTKIADGCIQVKLLDGTPSRVFDVSPVTWDNYRYRYDTQQHGIVAQSVGSYTQYPLMLAWAVTIHKAQGKTLENVLIDFGNGAFASGQAYVALSRCRSMEGLRLARPLRTADVICDPVVRRFYREHRQLFV